MRIRVSCYEPRSPPQSQHFSRLVRPSKSTSTRPIQMQLQPTSPPHSTPNRKKRSPSSSVRTGTSSHGSLLTCQVFPGDWLSTAFESTQKSNQLRNISDGPPFRRERPLAKK